MRNPPPQSRPQDTQDTQNTEDEEKWATPGEIAVYMVFAFALCLLPAVALLLAGRGLQEALLVGTGIGSLFFFEVVLALVAGWNGIGKRVVRALNRRGG